MQWISSEIKLRRSHHTGHNPKPYAGTYYIIRTNKGKGNINENPDRLLLYLLETGLLIYRVFYLIIKQSIGSQKPAHESDVRSTCYCLRTRVLHG